MGCCQSRTDETEFRNSISSVILSKSQPEELTTNNEPEHEIEEIIAGDQAQEKAESNLIKFSPLIMQGIMKYTMNFLKTAPTIPIDPNIIPEFEGLENIGLLESRRDSIISEKLRQADAILHISQEFETDFEGEGLIVKFQEYFQDGQKFFAGLTDIDFGVKVPSQKLVEFLNLRANRIKWDFDLKALEVEGDFMNDYIQYTRIENPKIFRKFYVERRLTKKYKNQIIILSFSVDYDPVAVPKHVNRMATEGINLLTAYYIKQLHGRTTMSVVYLYENTEFAEVEEKIKVSEGKNWVNTFKKMLFKP
jgi:hypothetical protein